MGRVLYLVMYREMAQKSVHYYYNINIIIKIKSFSNDNNYHIALTERSGRRLKGGLKAGGNYSSI